MIVIFQLLYVRVVDPTVYCYFHTDDAHRNVHGLIRSRDSSLARHQDVGHVPRGTTHASDHLEERSAFVNKKEHASGLTKDSLSADPSFFAFSYCADKRSFSSLLQALLWTSQSAA